MATPTFKLHLQHLVLVVDDVAVGVEGVTGTVHADLQAQVGSCRSSRSSVKSRLIGVAGIKLLPLTSAVQPLAHRLGHVEGDPLSRTSGLHVLGGDVALLPDVSVGPQDLQGCRVTGSQTEFPLVMSRPPCCRPLERSGFTLGCKHRANCIILACEITMQPWKLLVSCQMEPSLKPHLQCSSIVALLPSFSRNWAPTSRCSVLRFRTNSSCSSGAIITLRVEMIHDVFGPQAPGLQFSWIQGGRRTNQLM